jgi:hypothetical protein
VIGLTLTIVAFDAFAQMQKTLSGTVVTSQFELFFLKEIFHSYCLVSLSLCFLSSHHFADKKKHHFNILSY